MELRHLRYFVAVAEEGSLTVAAERRLHTAQPSLCRQIRDLEYEVGAQLLVRSARGVELTDCRPGLSRPRAAGAGAGRGRLEAARRAAQPSSRSRPGIPDAGRRWTGCRRRCASCRRTCAISKSRSPANIRPTLRRGLRRASSTWPSCVPETQTARSRVLGWSHEPLVVVMPSDHRLTAHDKRGLRELAGETFIGGSDTAGPCAG